VLDDPNNLIHPIDGVYDEAGLFLDSALAKVAEKLPGRGSSSSDSNEEKSKKPEPSLISALEKRLFGSEKPVQRLFGGIKCKMSTFWFFHFQLVSIKGSLRLQIWSL